MQNAFNNRRGDFAKPMGQDEARKAINCLGAGSEPFLFVTDYEAKAWHVGQLRDIDPRSCLYAIGDYTNATSAPHAKPTITAHPPKFDDYAKAFDTVMCGLRRGDSFLTNLTWAVDVNLNGSLTNVFHASRAPFRLFMQPLGGCPFVCFSPEPFVSIDRHDTMRSYPMKGTAKADSQDSLTTLMNDAKEAAEHATIVDLIRNDMSQHCAQVRVERYRYAELIETSHGPIWQTSSAIAGQLQDGYRSHMGDILISMLPAGSITGAPKRKTVEIIDKAEPCGRGYYTGVMGICHEGRMTSAVMIRFISQEAGGGFRYHAGGGITARSNVRSEFEEVLTKVYL